MDKQFHFQEQYEKMIRWFKRLESIYKEVPGGFADFDARDIADVFFQNCYHLWDWIKEGSHSKISQKDIQSFIHNSECLKVCKDLCNGSKHAEIISDTDIHSDYVVDKDWKIHGRILIVKCGDKKYDALDLAKKCIEEWNRFFKEKGISWFPRTHI